MKLRNKKTGDIWEFDGISMAISDSTKEKLGARGCSGSCYARSLSELNKEWEDYKPAEPLIKDEKIRKAVRAWAEVLEVNEVESYGSRDWIGLLAKYDGSDWSSKFELDCYGSENTLVSDKKYTIAELCGKEEE